VPEVIDIRQLETRALAPLLEAESQAWEASLRWNYSASVRVISSCLDEKRLSGYALLDNSQITGYSFFFQEGGKGVIGNLFVAPDGPRLERAQILLEHVIGALIDTPGLRRVETQLPHFTLEELEPYFRARCFEAYLRRFMALSLTDRRLPGPETNRRHQETWLRSRDFLLEPWERTHDVQAARLLYNAYRNHADAKINDQYSSLAGATRLIENIVQHRGCGEHLPQASLVAIHRSTQRLASILALTAVRGRTAHIPQIAVAPEFQGAGLGTAMLELAFWDLARRGYQEVSLTVTDLNCGAVRLYERLGFQTFRTFGAFVWNRLWAPATNAAPPSTSLSPATDP